MRRKLTRRQVSAVKREAAKHPLLTSKQLFEKAGVSEVPRTSRCRLLQTVAKSVKLNIHPPLTSRHKAKRVEWARHYMKVDFQTDLLTDECRATLDGHTYMSGRQYNSKDEFWDGICKAVKSIVADQVQKLTNSVDSRLVEILSNKGCYVNK